MTRAVEQIERDIAALGQAVEAIAQEFHNTYKHYLTDLGPAVKKQLVLVAYYICTQGYPDRFLHLSFSQRQELQQTLQKLGKQFQNNLSETLQPPGTHEVEIDPELQDPTSSAEETSDEATLEIAPLEGQAEELEISAVEPQLPLTEAEEREQPTELSKVEQSEGKLLHQEERSLTPNDVANWHETLELKITEGLQTLSHAANRLLQEVEVLPGKLPEPLLEVAAKAATETAGPPNLLNLLIETNGEDEESKITHVMAIRLRLSEIEFADSTLTAWRSKIRGLLTRLNHLGKEHQKKQKEKAIAEAEAAWRASWFEE